MVPGELDRRAFLGTALGLGAIYLSGCSGKPQKPASKPLAFDGSGKLPGTELPDPFADGEYLGTLKFASQENWTLGNKVKKGHDARLAIDLASLVDPATHITPNDQFYIRTEFPDRLDPKLEWTLKINGHVKQEKTLKLDDLRPMVQSQGATLLECAGNASEMGFGLLSVAEWSGVPSKKILDLSEPTAKAKRVLLSGFDERSTTSTHSMPGASWIFTFDDLVKAKAYLATEMNGEPLPPDHGKPLRLIVPNWYGCCSIKWLNSISFVGDDERATGQMIEFAGRTHQEGMPTMCRDFAPATMDLAAIPVCLEKWKLGGKLAYRVLGISWGGDRPTDKLQIRFDPNEEWRKVDVQTPKLGNLPFGVWCHKWQPTARGAYQFTLRVDDPSIRTRRLDTGYYVRSVRIKEI